MGGTIHPPKARHLLAISTSEPIHRRRIDEETPARVVGSSFLSQSERSRTVCISGYSSSKHVLTRTQVGRPTFPKDSRGLTGYQWQTDSCKYIMLPEQSCLGLSSAKPPSLFPTMTDPSVTPALVGHALACINQGALTG